MFNFCSKNLCLVGVQRQQTWEMKTPFCASQITWISMDLEPDPESSQGFPGGSTDPGEAKAWCLQGRSMQNWPHVSPLWQE